MPHNDFLSELAHLLDLIREHRQREPTDNDRRLAFAAAAGTDLPPT